MGDGSVVLELERLGPATIRAAAPGLGLSATLPSPELSFRALSYLFPAPRNARLQAFQMLVFDLQDRLQDATRSLVHLGPLRDVPERAYRADQVMAADRTSFKAIATMQRDQDALAMARESLRRLGIADEISLARPAPGYLNVVLRDPASGLRVNLADVGFGASQVLPILAALGAASEGDLLLIEQPELHLHPETQGVLADILLETALGKRLTLLVETHSEHLLLRVQRRVAERADPSAIAAYVVDGGALARIGIDAAGKVDASAFPDGFFEEEWLDAVELAKAAARRS